MDDVLVILPTYNEIDNLGPMVHRILGATHRADILVVDDNSPDGTGDLADALAEASDRIFVLHRTVKSGLGDAYRAGFAWGLERDYDLLVEMDADGSHQPEQLPDLLAGAERADVVLGSRWVDGGGAPNWAFRRALLSRAGSLYARIALGLPMRDLTGGYRVFRADALRALDYQSVEAQGYCFQIEMVMHAVRAGLRVVEVPIVFAERTSGVSKMSGNIVSEAILRVTIWGIIGMPDRVRRAIARTPQERAGILGSDEIPATRTPVHGGAAATHRIDGRD
ncbi:MAG: glycosyltransferase [Glaciihabitans sp.]|jgi:dolichol-phosphate mannosyltransferase|nr:glycosyltransferase [Glaciihabitans sp.]